MADLLINATEIPYIIMGGYSRLMEMFGEYRSNYGLNQRRDRNREDEMLILFTYVLCVRHNNTNPGIINDLTYQKVVNDLYLKYSLDQFSGPILNGIQF